MTQKTPFPAIKAIVFDCDGVLVDTEALKFQAWERVLRSRGITLSPERYQLLVGLTGLAILAQIGEELDPKIVDEKNELYWTFQKSGLKPIEPMISVVEWAKTMGIRLGVASSACKSEVQTNLKYLKIMDYFDVVLSGKDDLKHYRDPLGVNKPQPYIYIEMSRQLGLEPKECLVFEDSEFGVRAAKQAGCRVIAVPTQWTMRQNFKEADLVLDLSDGKEIVEIIRGFLQIQ